MIISLIIILIISLSGLSLTYLFAKDETFLWRLSAGNIVGSALFGLVCFIIANFFGLSVITVLVSLAISVLPLFLLKDKVTKRRLKDDWQHGKDKTQGVSAKRFWRLAYYLFFLILFLAFFDRAMIFTDDGIFTGASQNLGDLPFHLGAIFSFTDGNNFPPQNPSFADAKFTYPFIADFLTACLVKLGASVQSAMLIQNVSWAFSLLVILERFVFKITNHRLAGKLAPFILFFSGGLGFMWFFKDYWYGTQGLWEILWNLPRDYTIGDNFGLGNSQFERLRWGNSLIALFITQRSLLFGMPLTIVVLGYLWEIFVRERESEGAKEREKKKKDRSSKKIPRSLTHIVAPSLIIGLIAGTLPLIHAHSLAVLFVVSAFLFFFSLRIWQEWILFGIGVAIIAVPELLWILSGSATNTNEFIAWHFGFDARDDNIFWFWLKNTGIFIPLLAAGLFLIYFPQSRKVAKEEVSKKAKVKSKKEVEKTYYLPLTTYYLLFFLPFLFIFIGSNVAKFAPWEWDNIKVLIYWFVGSIPFAAFALAWAWQRDKIFKAIAVLCLIVLIFSGALDVWRTASGQMRNGVFDADAVKIAEELKKETEPNALFLNAPTYNSAIVLSGRRSLMRYIGHLSSHGIDYAERENDLKQIYSGEASADILLKKYGIDYVLISPKEREYFAQFSQQINEQYFQKFTLAAVSGEYRVYKVK
ncbi:MAG: hypothetical protein M3405_15230 [Acidobacteriota bacterium]|jgi:hypothetical protein|nr:hypothetical protein [Acidobacteriota bacterium]